MLFLIWLLPLYYLANLYIIGLCFVSIPCKYLDTSVYNAVPKDVMVLFNVQKYGHTSVFMEKLWTLVVLCLHPVVIKRIQKGHDAVTFNTWSACEGRITEVICCSSCASLGGSMLWRISENMQSKNSLPIRELQFTPIIHCFYSMGEVSKSSVINVCVCVCVCFLPSTHKGHIR